jgi:hypothetical protein
MRIVIAIALVFAAILLAAGVVPAQGKIHPDIAQGHRGSRSSRHCC